MSVTLIPLEGIIENEWLVRFFKKKKCFSAASSVSKLIKNSKVRLKKRQETSEALEANSNFQIGQYHAYVL